ncbi:MAG TPA: hypothetical protein GXZ48_04055, partial [Acholeplasmataceae bacterium]|nr:hypothetical protein [Acholeplasmataceae bacterium]
MKGLNTFRLHLYCLRFVYLLLIIGFTLLTSFLFIKEDPLTFYKVLGLILVLYSFLFGIYQYNVISKSYLSIKINRNNFYNGAILYLLIQLIILMLICFGFSVLIDKRFEFIITNKIIFFYYSIVLLLLSLIGNFIAIIFSKIKVLFLLFIILITIAIMNYEIVINFINLYYEYIYTMH